MSGTKRFLALFLMNLIMVAGCGVAKSSVEPGSPDIGQTVQAQDQIYAEKTLSSFAERVSAGDVLGAAKMLAVPLRGAYEYQDYAPIRNTPSMEIVEIRDMSGQWPPDLAGIGSEDTEEAFVFFLRVKYQVLDLIPTSVEDGKIFNHKATVAKLRNGDWLISEMSATPVPRN